MKGAEVTVWIGTTTGGDSDSLGIYRATLNNADGSLTKPVLAAEIAEPNYLVLNGDGERLYTVCNLSTGEPGVASFTISGEKLNPLSAQPIGSGGAAHLALDRSEKLVFTAQYGASTVALFPVESEGTIGPRSQLETHTGAGPNKSRQEKPHPHWVGVDPTNRYLFVPDLGIDRVVIYAFDAADRTMTRHGEGVCPPGSGPRHLKFHPNGKWAYVLNELGLSVTAFHFDADKGTLEEFQTISTLPENLREVVNSASEIRIHPTGKFLYAANRGHDSIAAFKIDPGSGELTFVELEAVRGSHPRNFHLDPSGRWLLAAGRDSNTVAVFRIDERSGELIFTGKSVYCPSPICIEFQK